MTQGTNWDPEKEEQYLRELAPVLESCMNAVKRRLPAATEFGILIRVPGEPEGRVIAVSTDREKFIRSAAEYVLNMTGSKESGAK